LSRASLSEEISDEVLKRSSASAWVISNGSVIEDGAWASLDSAVATRFHEVSASSLVCSSIDSSLTARRRAVCSARSR
jgi:hypothetical protein